MTRILTEFWADERGATIIEYALIAGIVSIAAIATIREIPTILNSMFSDANDGLIN